MRFMDGRRSVVLQFYSRLRVRQGTMRESGSWSGEMFSQNVEYNILQGSSLTKKDQRTDSQRKSLLVVTRMNSTKPACLAASLSIRLCTMLTASPWYQYHRACT